MKEKPVEEINMDNGYNLEIYDISREIAPDTNLVGIIFRIRILIDKGTFKINKNTPDYLVIIEKLGPETVFEVKYERNFIKNNEKKTVFNEIKNSFLDTNLKYLSSMEFAEKFILKKYNELK